MTHGTRIDINAIKSVLTRWITEGHITPLAAFNRFWGYTFHLMQEDEITNDEYNQVQLEYLQEILAPHIRRILFQHWKLWSHCTDGTLC